MSNLMQQPNSVQEVIKPHGNKAYRTTHIDGSAHAHLGDKHEVGTTWNVHQTQINLYSNQERTSSPYAQNVLNSTQVIKSSADPNAVIDTAGEVDVVSITLSTTSMLINAVKVCAKETSSLQNGATAEKLPDGVRRKVYGRLHTALYLFKRHVKRCIESSSPMEDKINHISYCMTKETLELNQDDIQALRSHLGAAYSDYELTLKNVCFLLRALIEDVNIRSQQAVKNENQLLAKLNNCVRTLDVKSNSADILRQVFLPKMKMKELGNIVAKIQKGAELLRQLEPKPLQLKPVGATADQSVTSRPRPSSLVPKLSRSLHRALSERFVCENCSTSPHNAQLCLETGDYLHRQRDPESIKYKLLISKSPTEFKEVGVSLRGRRKHSKITFNDSEEHGSQINDICTTLRKHQTLGKLRFTAEHFLDDGTTSMIRDRDEIASNFIFDAMSPQMTLASALSKLDLIQKRKIALALAYGCMTIGATPWLAHRWSKNHIHFFFSETNCLCDTQPMIISELKHRMDYSDEPDLPPEVCHAIPTIQSLGIVLLELETGKAIETLRHKNDLVNGEADANTDLLAAIRAINAHATCTPYYREAIMACLHYQCLVDQGVRASLNEESVRSRIYQQIIQKLEAEVDALMQGDETNPREPTIQTASEHAMDIDDDNFSRFKPSISKETKDDDALFMSSRPQPFPLRTFANLAANNT